MWRRVAPHLAERYTVVATDLRGYGDSGKPQPVTGAASSVTPTPRSRGLADGDGRLDTAAAGLSNSRHRVLAAQRAAASNAQTLGQVPSPCQQRSRP